MIILTEDLQGGVSPMPHNGFENPHESGSQCTLGDIHGWRSPMTNLPAALSTLTIMLMMSMGCETAPSTRSAITQATEAYEAGQLEVARAKAVPLVQASGPRSDEAAWIVGLCDYREGNLASAESRFRYVTTGTDRPLAAQARVMLGQIELAQGQPSQCLASLARAWSDLPETHHRRAAELGVTAAEALDDPRAEDLWLSRMPAATSRTTSQMISLRERFTLQAGAFRNRDGAESAKVQLEEQPGINKLGTANIRTRTDRRGDTLYLVQIGSFSTRSAADAARRGMDAVEFVVVAQ